MEREGLFSRDCHAAYGHPAAFVRVLLKMCLGRQQEGKNPHPQRDQILVHRLHKFACRGLSLRLYGRQRRQGTAARGRRGPERRSLLENSLDADPVDMSRHDTFRHYEALRQQTATYEVGFLAIASVIRSVKGSHSVANVPSGNSQSRAGQPVAISVTRRAVDTYRVVSWSFQRGRHHYVLTMTTVASVLHCRCPKQSSTASFPSPSRPPTVVIMRSECRGSPERDDMCTRALQSIDKPRSAKFPGRNLRRRGKNVLIKEGARRRWICRSKNSRPSLA